MKMIKKSIIAIALVAIMVSAVQAGGLKRYTWECDFRYVAIDAVKIPVFMDIGLVVDIFNQGDLLKKVIKLKQVDWQTYESDLIKIQVKCNFDLWMKATFEFVPSDPNHPELDASKMGGEVDKITLDGQKEIKINKTLCNSTAETLLYLKLKKMKTEHIDFQKNFKVGYVTLWVKPAFDCVWQDP